MSVLSLQRQIHQERHFSEVLNGEFSKQRESVMAIIHQLIIEHRTFCLLDSRYPSLSESDIEEFLTSELFTHMNRQVYSSATALEFDINTNLALHNLSCEVHRFIPLITDCSSYYFNHFNENLPIHPCKRLLSAFVSSTFPTLFGYCWNLESTNLCVSSICKLIDRQIDFFSTQSPQESVISSHEFRNCFIKEFVRQFYHITGVHKYLKMSLMSPLLLILNDTELSISSPAALTNHSRSILASLLKHLPWMPSALRLFFQMAFSTVMKKFPNSPGEANFLLKYLFFEVLVQPALLNPKLYAIFPINYVMPDTKRIADIAKITSSAFGLRRKPSKVDGFEVGVEEASNIIKELSTFAEEIQGVSRKAVMRHFSINSYPLLFSPSDIILIAHIVNKSISHLSYSTPDCSALAKLCEFENSTKEVEFVDFWTEIFEDFSKDPLKIERLKIPILTIDSPEVPNDDLTHIAEHLISYLQTIPIDTKAPENISDFLEYQLQRAKDTASVPLEIVTLAVKAKFAAIHSDQESLFSRVKAILNYRLSSHNLQMSLSFSNQDIIGKLKSHLQSITDLNLMQRPMIYQSLIRLYFARNRGKWESILSSIDSIVADRSSWLNVYGTISSSIIQFATDAKLGEEHKKPLQMQIHSFILKEIPLIFFIEQNKELMEKGRKFFEKQDEEMDAFVKQGHSDALNKLLKTGVYFESSIEILRGVTRIGAPLEIVEVINNSLSILEKIYGFESGEDLTGDDFLPLVICTIIKAGIPEIFALRNYLQHFLEDENGNIIFFDSKEQYIYAAFVTAVNIIEHSFV